MLGVHGSNHVNERKEFFDGVKDGRDLFMRLINFLLENFLTLEELVQNYLPIFFGNMCEDIGHGVTD